MQGQASFLSLQKTFSCFYAALRRFIKTSKTRSHSDANDDIDSVRELPMQPGAVINKNKP